MSHIAVERNRRRQMNDHLKVLPSLTPALYIKRGDQASIISGAIDFIRELQQVLESLEARKRRRSTNTSGGFSPSPTPSPRSHLALSSSSSGCGAATPPSPPVLAVKELAACCNSPVADVEARISSANVLLRTLYLSRNHISGAIPDAVARLQRLVRVDLADNSLRSAAKP
ncbi:transcription factor MUTE-like [Panicum virgatum]|uniref:transcription factor MUTE-like n=1 Tax=Panicum virgatum TaxID=38727 RepID=UPI0019D618B7|nr:transcription factor MUTE-like [Panicum virgatum]